MPNGDKNTGGVNPTKPQLLERVRNSLPFTASDYDKKHSVDKDNKLLSRWRVGEGQNDGYVLQGASYRGRNMNFNYEPNVFKGGHYDEYAKTGEIPGYWGQEYEKYNQKRALELEDGTVIEGFEAINQYLSEQKGGYGDVAYMYEGEKKYRHRPSTKHRAKNYFKDSQTAGGWQKNMIELGLWEGGKNSYGDRIKEKDKSHLYGSEHGLAAWFRQLDMDSLRVNDIIDEFNAVAEGIHTGAIVPRENPKDKDKGTSGTPPIKGGVSANTKKI